MFCGVLWKGSRTCIKDHIKTFKISLWTWKSLGVSFPAYHGVRGRVHPGQVASLSQGSNREREKTFTLTANLESIINRTCMSLDSGKKPEYPERTCKFHTEGTHPVDSNAGPSYWEMLHTAPPWHLKWKPGWIQAHIWKLLQVNKVCHHRCKLKQYNPSKNAYRNMLCLQLWSGKCWHERRV